MKLANQTLLLAITFMVGAGIGRATPVLPGGTVFNDTFSASQDIRLLADNLNVNWSLGSGSAAASGTYTDAVYRNTAGTLDFVYQFTESSTSKVGITSTSGYNFATFTTDVGYVTNGAALPGGIFMTGTVVPGAPNYITRSSDGSTITFAFSLSPSTNIGPGVTSSVLMVSTNATKFEAGAGGILASGTYNILGFQPTFVPEPSSLLPLTGLFLIMGGLVAIRRRRRVQIVHQTR
jgi:hypothetical protein